MDGDFNNGQELGTDNQGKLSISTAEIGKHVKQRMKELLMAWIVKLWDVGADGIRLSATEVEKEYDVNYSSPWDKGCDIWSNTKEISL